MKNEQPATGATDVVILGMGYVGLPLATAFARSGLKVTGFDINEGLIAQLRDGISHVSDVSSEELRQVLGEGLQPTADTADLNGARVFIVCVPTPLDQVGEPDLSAVLSAAQTVRRALQPGNLVVLESTTYPGTTDGMFRTVLEESGLRAGEDFCLAFSPERVDPGNTFFSIKNTPKVVGGLTTACGEMAADLYRRVVDQVLTVSGPREAELAKLIENTYRHVNIALVNEMAVLAHTLEIDIWESIRAAATKPFGFQAFYPGPGVGGHCIPIDPQYLAHAAKSVGFHFRFASLAQDVNSQMHGYVVRRVQDLLNSEQKPLHGSHVLLLGMSYKADVPDLRESPSIEVAELLIQMGAAVSVHDPNIDSVDVADQTIRCEPDLTSALESCDVVVLLQSHREYEPKYLLSTGALIFDCRGVFGLHGLADNPKVHTL